MPFQCLLGKKGTFQLPAMIKQAKLVPLHNDQRDLKHTYTHSSSNNLCLAAFQYGRVQGSEKLLPKILQSQKKGGGAAVGKYSNALARH